jgi:hypothetical protein
MFVFFYLFFWKIFHFILKFCIAEKEMEQVIEAVTDAVSQLVVFSVEAEENTSVLSNIGPGAMALAQSVTALLAVAEEASRSYGSEPKIQEKMTKAAAGIRLAVQDIEKSAATLSADPFHKQAKKDLLVAAKDVLMDTVRELYLSDKYDVLSIERAVEPCREEIRRAASASEGSLMMDVARALAASVVRVIQLVQAREGSIPDPIMKRRVEEAKEKLKGGAQSMIAAMDALLQAEASRDSGRVEAARAQQLSVSKGMNEQLDVLVQACRESNKNLFSAIQLDFDTEPPKKPTLADLQACHEELVKQLGALAAGARSRAAQDCATALHLCGGAISRECEIGRSLAADCPDASVRQELEALVAALAQQQPAVIARAKEALRPASAVEPLLEQVQRTEDASKTLLLCAARTVDVRARVLAETAELHNILSMLDDAAVVGNPREIAKLMKRTREKVADAVALARVLASETEDPYLRSQILKEVEALESQLLPALEETAAALIKDPNDESKRGAFRERVAELDKGLTRLERTCGVRTAEELLTQQDADLQQAMRSLEDAVRRGDTRAAAAALKLVRDAMREQEEYARKLASDPDMDPLRRRRLLDAADALADVQRRVVDLTKRGLAGDEDARAELSRALKTAHDASREIAECSVPSTDAALKKASQLADAELESMLRALNAHDAPAASASRARALAELQKEIDLLHEMTDGDCAEDNAARRRLATHCANELDRLLDPCAKRSTEAIADMDNAARYNAIDSTVADIRQVHADMQGLFPSRQEQLEKALQKVQESTQVVLATENGAERVANCKQLARDVLAACDLAQSVSNDLGPDGAAKKAQLDRDIAELKKSVAPFVQATAANSSVRGGESSRTAAELAAAAALTARAAAVAQTANSSSNQQALVENAASINALISAIEHDSCESKEASAPLDTARSVHKLDQAAQRQAELVRRCLDPDGRSDNPLLKSVLKNAEELAALSKQLGAVAVIAADPKRSAAEREAARKKVHELAGRAKELNASIMSAVADPAVRLHGNTAHLDEELQRMVRAIERGDADTARDAASRARDAIDQQLMLLQQMLDGETDPERRREIMAAMAALEALRASIDPLLERALTGDAQALAELQRLVGDVSRSNAAVSDMLSKSTYDALKESEDDLRKHIAELNDALDRGDRAAAEEALAKVQKDLAKQIELVRRLLADPDLTPEKRRQLEKALAELEHTFNTLPKAVRDALDHPGDPKYRDAVNALTARAMDAAALAVKASSPSAHDQIAELSSALLADVDRKDGRKAVRDCDELVALVRSKALGVDADAQRALDEKAAVLERKVADFARDPSSAAAAAAVQAATGDVLRTAALATLAKEHNSTLAKMSDKQGQSALVDSAADNDVAIGTSLDRLAAAVRSGDRQAAMDALEQAQLALSRQAALARALAADPACDAARRDELLAAAARLDAASANLDKDTRGALNNPNDRAAQERLAQTMREARNASSAVVGASTSDLESEIERLGREADAAMRRAQELAAKGDLEGARAAAAEAEQKLRRRAALCRAAAAKTTDPAKKKLFMDMANSLNDMLANLMGPLMNALNAGDSASAADLLSRAISSNNQATANFKRGTDELNKPKEPTPPPPAEEPKEEIAKAAFHVEQALKDLQIDESTPQGKIYATSRRIAEQMKVLSRAAEAGHKVDVIGSSRTIAALATDLFKYVEEICKRCTDPRLIEQVMSVAHAVRTITTQLKIITAVKAASVANDPSVKAQLVKCAQSLSQNVMSLCNSVEIASIRLK